MLCKTDSFSSHGIQEVIHYWGDAHGTSMLKSPVLFAISPSWRQALEMSSLGTRFDSFYTRFGCVNSLLDSEMEIEEENSRLDSLIELFSSEISDINWPQVCPKRRTSGINRNHFSQRIKLCYSFITEILKSNFSQFHKWKTSASLSSTQSYWDLSDVRLLHVSLLDEDTEVESHLWWLNRSKAVPYLWQLHTNRKFLVREGVADNYTFEIASKKFFFPVHVMVYCQSTKIPLKILNCLQYIKGLYAVSFLISSACSFIINPLITYMLNHTEIFPLLHFFTVRVLHVPRINGAQIIENSGVSSTDSFQSTTVAQEFLTEYQLNNDLFISRLNQASLSQYFPPQNILSTESSQIEYVETTPIKLVKGALFFLAGCLGECLIPPGDLKVSLIGFQKIGNSYFFLSEKSRVTSLSLMRTQLDTLKKLDFYPKLIKLNCNETSLVELSGIEKYKNLQDFSCERVRINDISPLSQLQYLQHVNLSNSNVQDITPLVICVKLISLIANRSPIQDPGENFFQSLSSLEELQINETRFTGLSSIAYASSLRYLHCQKTLIKSVRPLSGHSSLEKIHFRHTNIGDLHTLSQCPSLRQIEAGPLAQWESLNSKDVMNSTMSRIPFLRNKNGCQISHGMPQYSLSHRKPFFNLQHLSLQGSSLTHFITGFFFYNTEEVLNWQKKTSFNQMIPIETTLFAEEILSIRTLDLSNTSLQYIDPEVWKLIKPVRVNLRGISVSDLPAMVHHAPSIQKLFISQTPTRDLTNLGDLIHLRELDLAYCPISSTLPLQFCHSLVFLCLSHCPFITQIHGIDQLPNLSVLDLSYTHVQHVLSLLSCSQLRWLNLAGTSLCDLCGFENFHKLEYLDLSNTHVKNIGILGFTSPDEKKDKVLEKSHTESSTGISEKQHNITRESSSKAPIQIMSNSTKCLANGNFEESILCNPNNHSSKFSESGLFSSTHDTNIASLNNMERSEEHKKYTRSSDSRIRETEEPGNFSSLPSSKILIHNENGSNQLFHYRSFPMCNIISNSNPDIDVKKKKSANIDFSELLSISSKNEDNKLYNEINNKKINKNDLLDILPPIAYSLRTLHAMHTPVHELRGIERLLALEELHLNNSHVSNVQSLQSSPSLRILDLSSSPIENIDGLQHIKMLESLSLERTYVTNVDILANCSRLRLLNLGRTCVSRISALRDSPKLEKIILKECSIVDSDQLNRFPALRVFSI